LHVLATQQLGMPIEDTKTPLKFNMEPEKQPLGKEIPVGNHHVSFIFRFHIKIQGWS